MDLKFDTLHKKVLAEIVKVVQKQGMQGTAGGWKDFLKCYDKKFGSSLSDPAKRSNDVLISFLKTFTSEDDLKFIAKILQCHLNREIVEQSKQIPLANETPEQRLVRLTLGHSRYALDYKFPACDEEWVVTELAKGSKMLRSNDMYAVDCEMVLCEDGSEALVRVCVVDRNLEVKLNELVKPKNAVADYRSNITGVTAEDLVDVTCSLADIQERMKNLLCHGTILVGHGLNNDLKVLKIDHARVIDTSFIFKYSDGPRRPSLNDLCKSVLGHEIRKTGAAHNCLDDACAAMKLVLAVIEHGDDDAITIIQADVAESERAKLLLHRIPIKLPSKELNIAVPGEFTIEVKPLKKAQGDHYSAVAIFKSPVEANEAFENVNGDQEKDSSGRPQKLVRFQSSTGESISLYVRKMVHDDSPGQILVKKRAFEDEEGSGNSKKLKMEVEVKEKMVDSRQSECGKDLKEIDRLKQELKEKDLLVSAQDKIISDLRKKLKGMKKSKKMKGH